MKYSVLVSGETVEVAFERTDNGIQATIGDRTYALEASLVEPGVYWLNWNNQSIEVITIRNGDAWSVSIGSHRIPVEILDARRKLQRTAHRGNSGAAEIHAPMPGKIVRVLASAGMEVEPNQGIVVMEAMKMQNEIKSPMGGRVQKLGVREGETVKAGDLIAIVE